MVPEVLISSRLRNLARRRRGDIRPGDNPWSTDGSGETRGGPSSSRGPITPTWGDWDPGVRPWRSIPSGSRSPELSAGRRNGRALGRGTGLRGGGDGVIDSLTSVIERDRVPSVID